MKKKEKRMLLRILISALLTVAVILIPLEGIWKLLAFLVPYLTAGWDILWKAARNILHGQIFDENFLMVLATIGAFCIGEYPEGVLVMVLYQTGEMFQRIAVGHSRRSIASLMDIRPDWANIEQDGKLVQVSPEEVQPGTVITIKPGERIPLDGVVTEGESSVNTAALTGESLPRTVSPGDDVISGCINESGLLRVRVTSEYSQSTVARILDLVENSSARKARYENFITRFARWYTPSVVIFAVLLAVLPPLFVGNWSNWINRALIFLVVSCPCALVISVPLSFFGGIGGASRKGILIKGGNYLEALADTDTVVFDKTGTLTQGVFHVAAVHPQKINANDLLEIAALAESYSDHPISRSLRKACTKQLDRSRVSNISELPGRGVCAVVDGQTVYVGNEKLMTEHGSTCRGCHRTGTLIHIAVNGQYAGHIVISDEIKPDASLAISLLGNIGIKNITMLTGDSQKIGEEVAHSLGLEQVYTNLLPAEKVERVEALLEQQTGKGKLAFVGDGINDAPVLSRADVGIAMGAMGSSAAIEAADIVLMDDKPSKIALAIRIARKTMRIVRENIIFALGIKGIVLVLGALGLANMWLAVFADVGVSLLAVLNAMRALRIKE